MSKAKAKGTAAETAVVRYLRTNGYANAERRALRGKLDCGDVTGIPGVVVEVKAEEDHPARPDAWFDETLREAKNASAHVPVLVVKVKYKPVERWDAWMPLSILAPDYFDLFPAQEGWTWVRMDLQLAVAVLREIED